MAFMVVKLLKSLTYSIYGPHAIPMDTSLSQPNMSAPACEVNRFQFDGKGTELFLLMLVNYILTILTLGIFSFWGRTRTRKYLWSHLTFMDDRLEYTGTGRELFVSYIKVIACFLIFGLGLELLRKYLSGPIHLLSNVVIYGITFLLIGFAQYSGRNYRLARTRWRGIRMGMTNARKEYMKTYVIYTLLMPLTLGLIAPVRWIKLRSILVNNTRIGNQQLIYTGDVREIYGKYILNIFLMIITFGIYGFWHKAWQIRYDYANTHLGEVRIKSILQGSDLLLVTLAAIFLVLFTFGLAIPWALRLWVETQTDTLAVIGDIPLHEIAQVQGDASSALGEEVAEFLDVDFGF